MTGEELFRPPSQVPEVQAAIATGDQESPPVGRHGQGARVLAFGEGDRKHFVSLFHLELVEHRVGPEGEPHPAVVRRAKHAHRPVMTAWIRKAPDLARIRRRHGGQRRRMGDSRGAKAEVLVWRELRVSTAGRVGSGSRMGIVLCEGVVRPGWLGPMEGPNGPEREHGQKRGGGADRRSGEDDCPDRRSGPPRPWPPVRGRVGRIGFGSQGVEIPRVWRHRRRGGQSDSRRGGPPPSPDAGGGSDGDRGCERRRQAGADAACDGSVRPACAGQDLIQKRRRFQPVLQRRDDARGQRGRRGVSQREKVPEQGGLLRLTQVGLAEKKVVAVVVPFPQRPSPDHQGA